jgi:hypothetical protein
LSFDSITHIFHGTPTMVDTLYIKITATDVAGASVSVTCILEIIDPFAISETKARSISIFPNPTNKQINISFGSLLPETAIVEICNIEGKCILLKIYYSPSVITIDLVGKPIGIYMLKLNIDGVLINRKICLIEE